MKNPVLARAIGIFAVLLISGAALSAQTGSRVHLQQQYFCPSLSDCGCEFYSSNNDGSTTYICDDHVMCTSYPNGSSNCYQYVQCVNSCNVQCPSNPPCYYCNGETYNC